MLFFPEYDYTVTWGVMGTTVLLYLLGIYVLRSVMASRSKANPKALMQLYNFAQIALCGYMTWGFAVNCFSLTNPFGLNNEFTAAAEWFIYVHYLSKFLDLLDTLFILLKKDDRRLSFLHVYHHSSILLIWGYLLQVGQGNGTAYFGAFINSIIHLIMYSHYFVTSMGINNPLKKYITKAQLIQFGFCLLHAFLGLAVERVLLAWLAWVQAAYHCTMLALFMNFYQDTYKKPKSGAKKHEADAKKSE